ncbi:MAG TPA: NAD(P)-dependent oxidoreductase [Caulobacteraceae bacterium]
MKVLVTGSAGHLGEALALTLKARGDEVIGLDRLPSAHTDHIGSITDPALVARCMKGVEVVFHAATLHKPHVSTHGRQAFVDTNVTGTLTLLEAASRVEARSFVLTSTTSVFGDAMRPRPGAPAVWVTEALTPAPRNIYGATKLAAETLCRLVRNDHGLSCVILRTSRFFPEADDDPEVREAYAPDNVKLNEFLYRRADIEDVVSAHLAAAAMAADVDVGPYVVSATTPFGPDHLPGLAKDAEAVVAEVAPEFAAVYAQRGWRMFPRIGRVYVNERARAELGWRPRHDFCSMLQRVAAGGAPMSDLAVAIGAKGYHRLG